MSPEPHLCRSALVAFDGDQRSDSGEDVDGRCGFCGCGYGGEKRDGGSKIPANVRVAEAVNLSRLEKLWLSLTHLLLLSDFETRKHKSLN